jgi:hypothetical protein
MGEQIADALYHCMIGRIKPLRYIGAKGRLTGVRPSDEPKTVGVSP